MVDFFDCPGHNPYLCEVDGEGSAERRGALWDRDGRTLSSRVGPGWEWALGEEARQLWAAPAAGSRPTGSRSSPHPAARLPGFPLGSGFPVSVLGISSSRCWFANLFSRGEGKEKGRRKRRRPRLRAGEERGSRRQSRVRSRPRSSGAAGGAEPRAGVAPEPGPRRAAGWPGWRATMEEPPACPAP